MRRSIVRSRIFVINTLTKLNLFYMSGINKVILVGHLGKEPDLRYLKDNVAVLSFPLATTEFINKNGERIEQTEWHNIVMWRGLAEAASKLLKKSKLIYIEGKCRTRAFEDKAGIKKYTTEVVAETFTLLGRNSDFQENEFAPSQGYEDNNGNVDFDI